MSAFRELLREAVPPMNGIAIRSALPEDMGFIIDAWRKSFADDSYLHAFDADMYRRIMSKHINGLSREPGAVLRVAHDEQDADTIIGFAVLTGSELHYVYVRGGENSLRRHGVARQLLDGQDIKTFTLRTRACDSRIKPGERGWAYAPRKQAWADGRITVEIA